MDNFFFVFQGKYEEMKALCIEYRDRYLSTSQHEKINRTLNETREEAEAEESRQNIETSADNGEFGTNEERTNGIIDGDEEFERTILSTEEIAPLALHENEEEEEEEEDIRLKTNTKQQQNKGMKIL